jgi:hypothetical protein
VVVRLLLELQTGTLALPLPSAFFFMMRCQLMPEMQLEDGGGIINQEFSEIVSANLRRL